MPGRPTASARSGMTTRRPAQYRRARSETPVSATTSRFSKEAVSCTVTIIGRSVSYCQSAAKARDSRETEQENPSKVAKPTAEFAGFGQREAAHCGTEHRDLQGFVGGWQ